MVAFTAKWPSDKNYTEWHYFKTESLDNGRTWSEPVPFAVHDNHAAICGAPLKLSDSEYLYACCFFDKRTKPLTGPVSLLAHTKNEVEASSITELPKTKGESPWKFGTHLHGCSVLIAKDDETTEFTEFGYIANRPLGLLEPTVIRLKNSNIAMLMRAKWGGFLWRFDSNDNGRTWSKVWQTDIPNPSSLACLIRLPDGCIGLLHNPSGGEVGEWGVRSPLSLWISNDKMNTWQIKADLITGGQLAYPNAIIFRDKLVFVYDKNRREAKFVEVTIPKPAP